MQVLRILSAITLALGAMTAASVEAGVTTTASISVSSGSVDVSASLAGGNAACGAKRVRKPWSSLTADEQSTYLEAVGIAIKNGIVSDLAAMHIEDMGEAQAHHSCAFFTWHRRMLLAYEGYLRDLGPKYACVTIPYYDVHTAYVQAANKKCSNMYECSGIFKAIGGESSSSQSSMTLNGEYATGYEVKGAPFLDNCDDNKKCGCMIRNNLKKRSVPSGAGFASFQSIVTSSKDYATFLENIQFGLHNEVHNAVGGVMSTFASPRDVFFFSWHGAIDMFLHTYHLCHIGVPLTESELKTSLEAFTTASQSCGGISGVGATTKVVQNMRVNGTLVDATQHPTLGKYFSHVGNEMWNYGDPQQLGDYSYSYELPEILTKQLLSNKDMCAGFNKAAETPAPTTAKPTTTPKPSTAKPTTTPKPSTAKPTTTPGLTTAKPTTAPGKSSSSGSGSGSAVGATVEVPTTTKPTEGSNDGKATVKPADGSDDDDVPTVKPTDGNSGYGDNGYGADSTDDDDATGSSSGSGAGMSASVGYDAYGKSILDSTKTHSGIIISESNATASAAAASGSVDVGSVNATTKVNTTEVATSGDYWVWIKTTYDGLVERFEGNMDLVAQQMHFIECQAFDNVFGVTEFSDDFVKNFHLASSRPLCGKKVDEIEAGNVTIAVNTTEFKADTITFAEDDVIQAVVDQYTPLTTSAAPLIDPTYVKEAEVAIANGDDTIPKTTSASSNASPASAASASSSGTPSQSAHSNDVDATGAAAVTPAPTKLRKSKKICDY
ncbi:Mucin-like protein [Globisporangium polare]